MKRLLVTIAICSQLVLVPARAEDQVDLISQAPQLLKESSISPANFTIKLARDLIAATLEPGPACAGGEKPQGSCLNDPNFYCIIHIAQWKKDEAALEADKWFVFRGGNNWTQAQLEGTRIYGSRRVGVLYVYLNMPVVPEKNAPHAINAAVASQVVQEAKAAAEKKEPYDPEAQRTKKTADYGAHWKAGRLSSFQDLKGRRLVRLGSTVFVADYVPIVYRVESKKKLPYPLQNALTAIGLPTAGGEKIQLEAEEQTVWAGRVLDIKPRPSDMMVRALQGLEGKELAKQTFDNEGKYRWDVSIALPVRATKELEYDSSGGTLVPKVVEKQNLYGLFNFFFVPVDTKSDRPIWPSFVAGVSLTGKPLDRTLVGLGWGIAKVQGFIGCGFNKVADPTGQPGASGSALTTNTGKFHYDKKLVFGVNLTARQVVELLKSKK